MSQAICDKQGRKALVAHVSRRYKGMYLRAHMKGQDKWRPTAKTLNNMAHHCDKEQEKLMREGSTGGWVQVL